jgi:pyridoxal phosphate enzyme (YggS family)
VPRTTIHYSSAGKTHYSRCVNIAAKLAQVEARIAGACSRSGRSRSSVTLVAVGKGHPPDAVTEAARCGVTLFGESKVQEAKAKIPLCPGRLRWHMIGHLQTNKCRDAVHLFEMIQSVDSLHLAEEINRRAEQAAKTIPVLLEVNIVGEASKFGYKPAQLLLEVERLNALPRLEIHGLMTIPPWSPLPDKSRRVFRELRELKERCEQQLGAPLPQLSMGMSDDFEVAIEEGSTMVRIGTAIFGERVRP